MTYADAKNYLGTRHVNHILREGREYIVGLQNLAWFANDLKLLAAYVAILAAIDN